MKIPSYLTTVTPLSRYLSIFLFIFLPMAGFLFGFYYGESVSWNYLHQGSVLPLPQVENPALPESSSPSQVLPSPIEPDTNNPGLPNDNNEIPTDQSLPGVSDGGDATPYPGEDIQVPTPPSFPPHTTSPTCGVTNCHGTEVTCGNTDPQNGLMCTMEYRVGDFCRDYVTCGVVNGSCEPIKDTRYETCVSCVEACNKKTDPMEAFGCEDTCRAME